jgi:hypothetical protein
MFYLVADPKIQKFPGSRLPAHLFSRDVPAEPAAFNVSQERFELLLLAFRHELYTAVGQIANKADHVEPPGKCFRGIPKAHALNPSPEKDPYPSNRHGMRADSRGRRHKKGACRGLCLFLQVIRRCPPLEEVGFLL